jgi:hypothetical protein
MGINYGVVVWLMGKTRNAQAKDPISAGRQLLATEVHLQTINRHYEEEGAKAGLEEERQGGRAKEAVVGTRIASYEGSTSVCDVPRCSEADCFVPLYSFMFM